MHAFRESSVPADQYTSERGKWAGLAKHGDIPVGGRVDKISVRLIYNVAGLMKRDPKCAQLLKRSRVSRHVHKSLLHHDSDKFRYTAINRTSTSYIKCCWFYER